MRMFIVGLVALTGCGQNFRAQTDLPIAMLYSQSNATASQCPNASDVNGSFGLSFYEGLDLNGNGLLDTNEITGIHSICNGMRGATGNTGHDGGNGHNSLVNQVKAASSLCASGGVVLNVGLDLNDDNSLSLKEIQSTAVICNGLNGTNGHDGFNAPPTPLSPTAILAPCAADPMHPTASELNNPALEVFLRLANGMILDSFSENISGYNTHFGLLPAGTYQSTGAGNCMFTVDSQGSISKK